MRKCACGTPLERRNKTGYCRTCSYAHQSIVRRKTPPASSFEGGRETATKTVTTSEVVKSLDDLVRVCDIDLDEWQVVSWTANAWGAAAGDQTLYQVKAHLKANRPLLDATAKIAALVQDAKRQMPKPKAFRTTPVKDGHLLELAIPDLHLGKLAWSPETGYADYDLKIAERLYEDAVEGLVQRTASFKVSRIVIPIGNDFLHADTKQGTTTRGTPLDLDTRYHKMYLTGRRLLTRVITRLAQIAPVTVVVVPGNHDTLSTFTLGDALECWFHQDPRVEVLNDPIPRKYVSFGATSIMFTHGDKGRTTDWPLLFATEQPVLFGAARFREIHTGHLHQTRLTEKMGVRVRVSPALCSADAWHSENLFVGNVRGAEAYVYHPVEGLIAVAHFTVPEEAS